MSQTQSSTHYTFTIYSDSPNASFNGNFDMYAAADGNDALALAIVEALNALSWPAGVTNPVSVSKVSGTSVVFTTNMSSTPPTFT